MASNYPSSLDSFTNPTSGDNLSTSVGGRDHAVMHSDEADAVESVQAELGANPSGSDATVVARLDRIETPTWTTVSSFSNGWSDAAHSGYPPVQYCKDGAGYVHLRGAVTSGTNFTTSFTLPAGFRPQYKVGATGLEIQTSGALTMISTSEVDLSQVKPFVAYS